MGMGCPFPTAWNSIEVTANDDTGYPSTESKALVSQMMNCYLYDEF
mgnify:CR=1 FL=1